MISSKERARLRAQARSYNSAQNGYPRQAIRRTKASLGRSITSVIAALTLATSPLMANPVDGTVVAGSATITAPNGKTVLVTQHTDKAAIDWRGFSIAADELTQFAQPGSGSIALNRVNGGNASLIDGALKANGQVWLINPAGIAFGSTAQVDVSGLLATTSDISNQNFMAGNYEFDKPGNPGAAVTNAGTITIGDAGLGALVAPWVRNDGVISAELGTVIVGSGETFALDFVGDGLVQFEVGGVAQELVQAGRISADGGSVLLTAADASAALGNVINMTGIVEARTVASAEGSIVLDGNNGSVNIAGTLDASGRDAGEVGGDITVTGEDIILTSTAALDVSGDQGGGDMKVGGGFQGKGPTPTADTTTVATGATLKADAITNGDGGEIIVWADGTTDFSGTISARGGAQGGDGGFAETSGKDTLIIGSSAYVNTLAPMGNVGDWLLDPTDLTIDAAFAGVLAGNLATTNQTVQTVAAGLGNGDIFVNAAIIWNSANSLTLQAHRNIEVNAAIQNSGTGDITLRSDDMLISSAVSTLGDVTLETNTNGRTIDLGTNAAGSLGLTDAELDLVTAGTLRVGTSTSGDITISSAISPAGTNTLSLTSGGAILDGNAAAGADITVANLALQAATGIGAADNVDLAVGTVAAANSTSGSIKLAQIAGAGNLTVGTVDGVVGINDQATSNLSQFQLFSGGDNLTINNDVTSARNVLLLGAGTGLLDNNAAISTTAGFGIGLQANSMALEGGTIVAGANGFVRISPFFPGQEFDLGSTSDAGASVELSNAELNTITAGTLQIGQAGIGDISVTDSITFTNVDTLSLQTSGAVLDRNLGTDITVDNLAFRTGGGVGEAADTLGLEVNNVAFNNTGGVVNFSNFGRDLTIGAVDGLTSSFNTGTTTEIEVLGFGDLTLGTALTSTGDLSLTTGGAIIDGNAAAGADITATNLALQAGTGIGGSGATATLETQVSNLEAGTTTGGIFINNTGDLTIGGVTGALNGVQVVTSGDIELTNAGRIDINVVGERVVGPDAVTLIANGATADILTGGDDVAPNAAVQSSGGTVTLSAGRDLLLGDTAGAGTLGNVFGGGSVVLDAIRDIIVDTGTFVSARGAGTITANAGRNISVFDTSGPFAGAEIRTQGGDITLTTGAGGVFTASNAASPAVQTTRNGGNGNITINADDMVIQNSILAGTGIVTLGTATNGQTIDLGTNAAGSLGLTDAELDRISADTLRVGMSTSGDITISDAISPANTNTLSLITGGAILDGNAAGADIEIANLALQAASGIGATDNLDLAVGTVAAANSTSGSIKLAQIAGAGNLTVGTVDTVVGVNDQSTSNLSQTRVSTSNSDLIINSDVTSALNALILGAGTGLLDNNAAISTTAGFGMGLQANSMALEGGTIVAGSNGLVRISPFFPGQEVDLGSASDAGVPLELSNAELNTITAGALQIGQTGIGDISVTGGITLTNVDTLSLQTSGAVLDRNLGTDITVDNLAFRTGGGVGEAVNALGIDVNNVAFNNTGGVVNFSNAGALTIGAVDGLTSSSNTGTTTQIEILGSGTLTVGTGLTSTGDLTLDATTIALNGGSVSGVGAQTYTGNVTLGADNVLASAGGGNIAFSGTVDGAQALTVNTSGTATFTGLVGGTTALTSLTTDAGGTTEVNGGLVRTTGSQTYNDQVSVGGTVFAATGATSDLNFANGITTTNADSELSLLAGDDINIGGSVQYDGTGDVSLVAGWDGTTGYTAPGTTADIAAIIAANAFGAAGGEVIIGDGTQTAGIAVGSRNGTTTVLAEDVIVQGSTATVGAFAQLGFVASNRGDLFDITGDIDVAATGDITVQGGAARAYAQIGHVGAEADLANLTTDANTSDANITLSAVGDIRLTGGTDDDASAQVGHGGRATTGTQDGDITITRVNDLILQGGNNVGANQASAQIGHGGYTARDLLGAGFSGDIEITSANSVAVIASGASIASETSAQIGHGGFISIADKSGAISISSDTTVSVTGGDDRGTSAQIGHGGVNGDGDVDGAITINAGTVIALSAVDSTRDDAYAQIGHGGAGHSDDQTGEITVTSGDTLSLVGGASIISSYAHIGHGDPFGLVSGLREGDIDVRSGGLTTLTGNTGGYYIGHGTNGTNAISNADVSLVTEGLSVIGGDFANMLTDALEGGSVLIANLLAADDTSTDDDIIVTGTLGETTSANDLALVSGGEVVFLAGIQNAGTGNIDIVGGWDGSTGLDLTGIPTVDVDAIDLAAQGGANSFGVAGGDVKLGDDHTQTQAVAVGSALGRTRMLGHDVEVEGSDTDVDAYAQIGFVTGATAADGDIQVVGLDDVRVIGGDADGAYAQIGHGGRNSVENAAGDIDVFALEELTVAGGGGANASAQIGHGGQAALGDAEGDITLDTEFTLAIGGDGDDATAQIGHGGSDSQGALSGLISILGLDSVDVVGGTGDNANVQVGHGGTASTGTKDGNIAITSGFVTGVGAGKGDDAYGQIGHGGGDSEGTITGDILVDGRNGFVFVKGGNEAGTYAHLGHGGAGSSSQVTGNIDVMGNLVNVGRGEGEEAYSQLGHGGLGSTGALEGDIDISAVDLEVLGGDEPGASAQVGHGGILSEGDVTGNITIDTVFNVLVEGGEEEGTYAQIGHGGAESEGTLSGVIDITSESVGLLGGVLDGLAAYAQIGHGGGGSLSDVVGNILIAATDMIGVRGGEDEIAYAQIGHGGLFSDGDLTGDITLTATDLEVLGGDASSLGAYGQVGHGGALSFGSSSGDITVDASDTIVVEGGDGLGALAHIGHGGAGSFGSADGSIDLTATTGIAAVGGDGPLSFAQIGHGGLFSDIASTGDITLDTDGSLFMEGGSDGSLVQVGHGGALSQGDNSGQITITADDGASVFGGSGFGSLAQIGHGGALSEGDATGGITLTTDTGVAMEAGDGDNAAAQIGHGGIGANGDHSGNVTVLAGTSLDVIGGTGVDAYAQIGHGDVTQVGTGTRSGNVDITVDGLTVLEENVGGFFLGHRTGTADGLVNADLSLTTNGLSVTGNGFEQSLQEALSGSVVTVTNTAAQGTANSGITLLTDIDGPGRGSLILTANGDVTTQGLSGMDLVSLFTNGDLTLGQVSNVQSLAGAATNGTITRLGDIGTAANRIENLVLIASQVPGGPFTLYADAALLAGVIGDRSNPTLANSVLIDVGDLTLSGPSALVGGTVGGLSAQPGADLAALLNPTGRIGTIGIPVTSDYLLVDPNTGLLYVIAGLAGSTDDTVGGANTLTSSEPQAAGAFGLLSDLLIGLGAPELLTASIRDPEEGEGVPVPLGPGACDDGLDGMVAAIAGIFFSDGSGACGG